MPTQPDFSTILFSPEEIGVLGTRYLEQRRSNKGLGVSIGLKSLDEVFYPLMMTEIMFLIARPGNGKTSFMMRWARARAKYLRDNHIDDRVVMYITLEQSVEELNAFNVAADERLSITSMARGEITDHEWQRAMKAGINRRFSPLWNIGYSAMREGKQPRLTVEAIAAALDLVKTTHGKTLDLVFVDYLQRLPLPRGAESKTVGVSENVDALKDIALNITKCPLVVGVQARREVDEAKPPIPQMDDGQWTSNVEQTGDRVVSLVRPINYVQVGEQFGSSRVDGPNELIVTILKQKLGQANVVRRVYFDPEYNKLDELEMRHGGTP
jgi:replicative DNA helicase